MITHIFIAWWIFPWVFFVHVYQAGYLPNTRGWAKHDHGTCGASSWTIFFYQHAWDKKRPKHVCLDA